VVLAAAECSRCRQVLVESYGAVIDLIQNGEVIRKASLFGLHQWCARDWARAEIKALRKKYGGLVGFQRLISRGI